jgi:erythromycin esterase
MAVTSWIRRTALPVDDPRPLANILAGTRVVGMAESTHGTREFVTVRHRLLRFLVAELGFTTLAIEGGYSAARAIDDFVLGGDGDPVRLLADLDSPMWCTTEFADVLEWLRGYNHAVTDAERVRFLGLDVKGTRIAGQRVLAGLTADRLGPAADLLHEIAAAEAAGPVAAGRHVHAGLRTRLRELAASGGDDLRVITQWVDCYLAGPATPTPPRNGVHPRPAPTFVKRSLVMAENLIRLADNEKVVVWAHTFHLATAFRDGHSSARNMGATLRDHFGDEYYALALELGGGRYLTQSWRPDLTPGDLLVRTVPPPPAGALPWHLAQAGLREFVLDLRRSAKPEWLGSKQLTHSIGWYDGDPPGYYAWLVPGEDLDGVIYLDDTTPTTPLRGNQ